MNARQHERKEGNLWIGLLIFVVGVLLAFWVLFVAGCASKPSPAPNPVLASPLQPPPLPALPPMPGLQTEAVSISRAVPAQPTVRTNDLAYYVPDSVKIPGLGNANMYYGVKPLTLNAERWYPSGWSNVWTGRYLGNPVRFRSISTNGTAPFYRFILTGP